MAGLTWNGAPTPRVAGGASVPTVAPVPTAAPPVLDAPAIRRTPIRDPETPITPIIETPAPPPPAPTTPTDPWANFVPQLESWFKTYLGRTPGAGEYDIHRQNPGGLDAVLQAILGSDEYKQRQGAGGGTGGGTDAGGPQGGDYAGWFASLRAGKPPTPAQLIALEPTLNKYGVKVLRNARGTAGKIQLPDGSIVDVIIGADRGGLDWSWQTGDGGGGGTGAGTTPGAPKPTIGTVPGINIGQLPNQFNNPDSAYLEDFIRQYLGELTQGVDDPFRDQYAALLQGRTDDLAGGTDRLNQLLAYLDQRAKELQTPGYTGAEKEIIRTDALDPIERDRQAARQRMLARLSERGLTPDSGIAQQALLLVDNEFDAMRAEAQRTIALNELGRRDDRANQALGLMTTGVDVTDAKQREALDTANALFGLSQGVRDETTARRDKALSLIGILQQMPYEALQAALATLGQGESPSGVMNSLLQIAELNNQKALIKQSKSSSFWSGMGSLAALLSQSQSKGGSGGGLIWNSPIMR